MIEVDENIIGIWFIALDNESDWLASMSKVKDGIKVNYRFRYYNSEDPHPFSGKDKKNFYSFVAPDDKKKAIKVMRAMAHALNEKGGLEKEPHEIINTGDLDEFIEELVKKDFSNVALASGSEV